MAIKFERIKPGMVLYDRHRHRMGNTTMSTLGEWPVRIISIDSADRSAIASWNGNRERKWFERSLTKLYDWSMYDRNEAELTEGMLGQVHKVRRLTKAERAAKVAKKESEAGR